MAPRPNPVSEWFSRRRFGLFLHFGLYAVEGWHEQDQMRRRIPRDAYGKLIDRFNPAAFDAERILDLAESVGMEYVCLTAKHHDGFCLWDSDETGFKATRSPCGRDLVRELADACRRRNFPLGIYYSVVDWRHPNYPNQGRHHELPGPLPGDEPDWGRTMEYLKRQVRELCTRYGEVRHFFWDMNVPGHRDPSVNAMLRELQPRIVVNDRGFDEGDFGTPERSCEIDGAPSLRWTRPTEACNSVGVQSWGWRADEDYYGSVALMQSVQSVMAKGGHYLLNVGPDASGAIPETAEGILRDVGAWYARVREAFDDAEPASEMTTNRGLFLTRRGDRTLYAHLPTPVPADAFVLPPLTVAPERAILLNTGEALEVSTDLLPAHWEDGRGFLRVKGLPRRLLSGPPLVARLDFAEPLPQVESQAARTFKG